MSVVSQSKIIFTALILIVCGAFSLATSGLTDDLPKRKSGLWEMKVHMAGMPDFGPMQQCIDSKTDDILRQESAAQQEVRCSEMKVKHIGNKVTIHAVCTSETGTATNDAVFEGSFDSAYKGTIKSSLTPPMNGMSEFNVSIEAKWLGPCQPGQKPGDIIGIQ
jgi:hypothetical protein